MKYNSKTVARYVDRGFGFPVILEDVTLIKIRDNWTPDINYNALSKAVLLHLAAYKGRLSGHHVKFIRTNREMTLQSFARRFSVTHPAVVKWERAGDKPSGMSWSIEKDIRLFIVQNLNRSAKEFVALYELLAHERTVKTPKITLDAEALAA